VLWVRLLVGLRTPGPVAPREAQLQFPLGGYDGDFGGCVPPLRATVLRGTHGVVDPQPVARRYPREVRRSGAPSRHARGG
jgi:hypothetical protein